MNQTEASARPPTPVIDADLERAVRQVTGAIIRIESRLEAIEALTRRSTRTRSLGVCFGVLTAMIAFAMLRWLVAEYLGVAMGL